MTVLVAIVAGIYATGASRRSPRGRRWPVSRALAFLAGLAVLAAAVDSGIATHDSVPAVHTLQHALLMMVAPPLLAFGKPVTLALRSLGPLGRRRLLSVLHEPSVARIGRRPLVLVVDYAATMAVVMLGPVDRWLDRSPLLHAAAHGYLVLCGVLFWTVVLAQDPVPGRLPVPVRLRMVSLSVLGTALLCGAVLLAPGAFGVHGSAGACGVAAVLFGAATLGALGGAAVISPWGLSHSMLGLTPQARGRAPHRPPEAATLAPR